MSGHIYDEVTACEVRFATHLFAHMASASVLWAAAKRVTGARIHYRIRFEPRSHLSGHVRSGADHPLRERVSLGGRAENAILISIVVVSTDSTKVCHLGCRSCVELVALVADQQDVLALDLACGVETEKKQKGTI